MQTESSAFARFHRSAPPSAPLPRVPERFGIRSVGTLVDAYREMLRDGLRGKRFQFDLRSLGLFRPDLSLPAYAGLVPSDRLAPICTLFDRVGGGKRYTQRVSRRSARDFRGGKLSYDEHDGTDIVCPIGTELVAAAPGVVVMERDRFLRGGLTIAVDHGQGVVTQYTHCSRALLPLGSVVKRGQPVALSGAAGVDMVQFFPWIPPHVHFMVYVQGVPVDPFLAEGERSRPGQWLDPEAPLPSGPRADDEAPAESPLDLAALERAVQCCTDAHIRAELAAVHHVPAYTAALLDDALTHDAWAFSAPREAFHYRRPVAAQRAARVKITLPLPVEHYAGVRFGDAPWTAP
jgi:murein DD-endopeptidase MepM/ murein hydrolase activator NlpD